MKGIRTIDIGRGASPAEAPGTDVESAKERQRERRKSVCRRPFTTQNNELGESTMRELESGAKGYRSLYEFPSAIYGSVQQETFPYRTRG